MTRPHHVSTVIGISIAAGVAGFYVGSLAGWWAFWSRRLV